MTFNNWSKPALNWFEKNHWRPQVFQLEAWEAIFNGYSFGYHGPIFGENLLNGFDICLYSNSDDLQCFSNLGSSYRSDLYPLGSIRAKNLLAGSFEFITEEEISWVKKSFCVKH